MLEQIKIRLLEDVNGGTPIGWLLMISVAVIGTVIVRIILKFVESRLRNFSKRFKGIFDNIIIECIAHTKSMSVLIWILNAFVQSSDVPTPGKKALFILFVVVSAIQVAIWGLRVIAIWRDDYLNKKVERDASSASAIGLMTTAVQGLFLIALVLMGLSNLGVDIAALIAGLGVGGIAVALAAQNILGDLFGSLSIVLDKPFVVGDFIVVGDDMGTVETIGIKTTRLRSLSGEELIFANKDLLESRVKNFKRMYERRAVLNFDVSYATPVVKLKQIPHWIEQFVAEEDLLRLDRIHLANFDVSSLKYELVYWVTDPDYNKYMDRQQTLIYKILTRFAEEQIDFALGEKKVLLSTSQQMDSEPLDNKRVEILRESSPREYPRY